MNAWLFIHLETHFQEVTRTEMTTYLGSTTSLGETVGKSFLGNWFLDATELQELGLLFGHVLLGSSIVDLRKKPRDIRKDNLWSFANRI